MASLSLHLVLTRAALLFLFLLPLLPSIGHCAPSPPSAAADSPLHLVNPLIGSNSGGNVFAGASLPYGLAKASPNVDGENTGGFASDGSNVTGFSAMHDSGTGGNPSLGNFPLFPQLCGGGDAGLDACRWKLADRATAYVNQSVKAWPGYFGLTLASGVAAEMAVASRTALFRFTFPGGATTTAHPLVLVDLTDLWKSRQGAWVGVEGGRVRGNGTFQPSFGIGTYDAFFCADFFGADVLDSGVWANSRAGTEPKQLHVTRGFNNFFAEGGAWVRFASPADNTVTVRMGLSFKSMDQACATAQAEVPAPLTDFDRLVAEAAAAWKEKLKPVAIKPGGVSEDLQKSFWSGVYRAMMSPQNYTGENPHWDSGIPYFDSFYCIWDSFRVQHPLLTIVDPRAQTQMINSLLDMYVHEGWLPDCHMSLCNGWTQGGSNADVVVADAYVKNLTAGIDWALALEAVLKDAEVEPPEWNKHGRGGLASWKALGYIPYLDYDPFGYGTDSRSVSRTLEYAYNDFCIASMAKGMGRQDLYEKYAARAGNWAGLWRPDQKSAINGTDTGFTGFFQPKFANGTWGYQDPIACSSLAGFCSLTSNPSETFEASIWQYQFIVPQSVTRLIALMGGDASFVARLDYFHASSLADISNEPVFLTVYLYHWAGRPGLSTKRIHSYVPQSFRADLSGLPGNDDSGAMGSFLFFSMLGLFPVAGQDVYLVSAPFFEELSVTSPSTGKTATVRCVVGGPTGTNSSATPGGGGSNSSAPAFDPTYKKVYIQRAWLNGAPWTRSWIQHAFFTEGWTLELELGEIESTTWGVKPEDRPPSF